MGIFKLVSNVKRNVWSFLGSEKTISALKLAAAAIATIHAFEEFKSASKSSKKKIGFASDEE